MSTRSNIGILDTRTGIVDYVYCHSDGYLSGVGSGLLEFYQDANDVKNLVFGGDISCLGSKALSLDVLNFIKECRAKGIDLEPALSNNEDITRSYYVWRNEPIHTMKKSLEVYSNGERDCGIEYVYLYKDGEWYARAYDGAMEKLTHSRILKEG